MQLCHQDLGHYNLAPARGLQALPPFLSPPNHHSASLALCRTNRLSRCPYGAREVGHAGLGGQ